MTPRIKGRVMTQLDVVRFHPDAFPTAKEMGACPHCGQDLDLSQPDPDAPERLLGICPGCGHWHLILIEPRLGTTVVTLPLVVPIRDAWVERDGAG